MLCSIQKGYAVESAPDVLISSGSSYNEYGLYHVEFAVGEVVIGDAVSDEPKAGDNTVGIGFYKGEASTPRLIHYYMNGNEIYTDTVIPGCEIIPFEAPRIADSLFLAWLPSLPKVMPERDLYVSAAYRSSTTKITPSKKKYCPGEIAEFTLITDAGVKDMFEYRIEYTQEQLNGGFVQYGYERLDVYDNDSVKFQLPIPSDYMGKAVEEFTIRFRSEAGKEVNVLLFRCSLDLPSSLLLSKYGELVLINSNLVNPKSVIWYKDGVEVQNGNLPYFQEPTGLYGVYSADLIYANQEMRTVCPTSMYMEVSTEKGISIEPNPAKAGEEVRISIKGFLRSQMDKAELDVFNILGSQRMLHKVSVDIEQYVYLPSGVYIVTLMLETGRVYSAKFVVY